MKMIPVVAVSHEETVRQAEVNVNRLNDRVDLTRFEDVFNRIITLKVSKRARVERFLEAAAELSAVVRPYTACKAGCSYCCNIAAAMTETEAQIIGKAIGRKPKQVPNNIDIEASQVKWTGVPCTFLKAGKCSIYEVRPLACRLHANLADTPYFCNTDIPSGVSLVPQINLNQITGAHAFITAGDAWGDIRDFFPLKV